MSTHYTNCPGLLEEVKKYCDDHDIDYVNTPAEPESISVDVSQMTQEHNNAISSIFDKYFKIKGQC